ncbi:MAG: DUF1697 domain-containing protein [Nocardioides sp.]
MPSYVAFLRAINLGATRKFPKDAIRTAVEAAGGTDVETYINTGNVRFTSTLRSRARVEAALEKAFRADRGFDVPTIVLTLPELAEVAADAEELAAARPGDGRHYVSLLKETPTQATVRQAEDLSSEAERVVVRGRAAHLMLGENYHEATLDNAAVEKTLGVATNRRDTVIIAMAKKWC